jgi:threonine synthase
MNWTVRCSSCGVQTSDYFTACHGCGGTLEVVYDIEAVRSRRNEWLRGSNHTIWGYADLLPGPQLSDRVSLGEGDTPLLPSGRLFRAHGRRVFWKNEMVNPTWSHKDRYQAVAATMARDLGLEGLAGTSTGNHGVSAAAYSSAAGLRCLIFYPPETSVSFLHLTGVYGGQAAVTGWDARWQLLDRVLARPGWCPIDGRNPFGIEGYKTIAYEVVRELGAAPDLFFVPVGSGKLIVGIWRGFVDLLQLGLIDAPPRFVACQATGVDVLSAPLASGSVDVPTRPEVHTVALSTREPTADARVLEVLRRSRGQVVTVSEGRIMAAAGRLAREGLAAEPASALPAAAVEFLCERGEIPVEAVSVCLLTSALVKTPDLLPELGDRRPWRLSVDGAELDECLEAAQWTGIPERLAAAGGPGATE